MLSRRAFSWLALAACVPGEKGGASPEDDARGRERARAPGRVDPKMVGPEPARSELTEYADALRERLSGREFTVVEQAPWVVIGDESPERVKRHAEGTIAWATEKLSDAYFDRGPASIVEIWLFRDAKSYHRNAKRLFSDEPDTPYGYYSYTHDALIMNIATGGGTLVHEMVHPLMRANFPRCPSWFNEGLASLYEQCGEQDGRIVGHTNWRLEGLQDTIEAGMLPGFATLLQTTEDGFYNDDPGSNYAQARYLCYWLQEKGKLRAFYRDFAAAVDTDPTGLATLEKHIKTDDLARFKGEWERWVMGLRFG